ncbi:MHO_4530 family protein [Mycoplasma sp. Z386]
MNKNNFQLDHLGIILVVIIILLCIAASGILFFVYSKNEKHILKNSSIIIPLSFDEENERIRVIDSKFKDSVLEVFKNKLNIYTGNWVKLNDFILLIDAKDRSKFIENMKTWSNKELDLNVIDKENKKETNKKYKFIFSNEGGKYIFIYRNRYSKINIKFLQKIVKKIKIMKIKNFKTNKRFSLFFNFSLSTWFINESISKNILEELVYNNFLLYFKIKQLFLEEGILILAFNSNNKRKINKIKYKLYKLFSKLKNNFFFSEQSVVIIDNKTQQNSSSGKIKKMINFSLWKSKNVNKTIELEHPYFLEYTEELEKYDKAIEEFKEILKKDVITTNKLELRKGKRKIGEIEIDNIRPEIKKFLFVREKIKIAEKILKKDIELKSEEKNHNFIYTYTDVFLNYWNKLDKNTSNLIIRIKSYSMFLKKFKEASKHKELTFDRWGIYVQKINLSLFSILKEIKPKFLVISYEILNNIEDDSFLISLETLNKICSTNKITIIYENKNNIIKNERILEKIGYNYYFNI